MTGYSLYRDAAGRITEVHATAPTLMLLLKHLRSRNTAGRRLSGVVIPNR
jgi:hypothetical protein